MPYSESIFNEILPGKVCMIVCMMERVWPSFFTENNNITYDCSESIQLKKTSWECFKNEHDNAGQACVSCYD